MEKTLENCTEPTGELLEKLSSGKLTLISRKKTVNSVHNDFSEYVKEERLDEALKYYEVATKWYCSSLYVIFLFNCFVLKGKSL